MILRCNLKSVSFKGLKIMTCQDIIFRLYCQRKFLCHRFPVFTIFQGNCRAAETRSDIPLPLESIRFRQSIIDWEISILSLCYAMRQFRVANFRSTINVKLFQISNFFVVCFQSDYFIVQLKLASQMIITSFNNSKPIYMGLLFYRVNLIHFTRIKIHQRML